MSESSHDEVLIEVSEAAEEAAVAQLWALGCEGSWSEPAARDGWVRVHAFFAADGATRELVVARLAELGEVDVVGVARVAPFDWSAQWRRSAQPIEVGERFVVDPREPGSEPPVEVADGRLLLRLPVRTAFGSGSHESTRLAVALLEREPLAGRRVLDVGTGSGILAFAALRLGAASVTALDLDPAAALLLPDYQRLNGLRFPAVVGTVAALGGGEFDLALVNVLPHEIAAELEMLMGRLAAGGRAIFSGVAVADAERALERLAAVGFGERDRVVEGDWVGFTMERA